MDWTDYQPDGMDIGPRISCNWRMYVAEFTGWLARMTCGRMGQALGVFLTGMEEGTRTGWMDIGGVIGSKVCAFVRYLRKAGGRLSVSFLMVDMLLGCGRILGRSILVGDLIYGPVVLWNLSHWWPRSSYPADGPTCMSVQHRPQ